MQKRLLLKKGIVRVLNIILISYLIFVCTTIDRIGNATYNKIFFIYSILAITSYKLLNKYSKTFE